MHQELKDDSQIIPRSSSVIVKRRPAQRPGRGKASMYVNGVSAPSIPTSEPMVRPGQPPAAPTWHKGAMSKRFDVKEEPSSSTSPIKQSTPVSLCTWAPPPQTPSSPANQTPGGLPASHIAKDEEAAAMAAMFQAQTQNWEETQEKMSQLVLPSAGFYLCSSSFSNEHRLLSCLVRAVHLQFAAYL